VQDKLVKIYIAHLLSEIKNYNTFIKPLKSIYFGGGTPSILTQKDLENIIFEMKAKFNFEKNIEISLETTPQNITLENIKSWEKIGINRISFGVQTLNNKALVEIGRKNNDEIFKALNNLSKSNIKNISLDFIIGLPFVKRGEILENIKFILQKYDFIKHISVYMLEDYYDIESENTDIYEKITYPTDWSKTGLDEKYFIEEYLEILDFLQEKGFFRYEISNFAKSGYECMHNISYWNHENNIGFGLGAHSFVNNSRFANVDDFMGYYSKKLSYSEKLTQNDIFLEKVLFSLRTGGISEVLAKKLNTNILQDYIKEGYLQKKGDKIILNKKYTNLIDFIIILKSINQSLLDSLVYMVMCMLVYILQKELKKNF
ncbi:MAG: radical SAM protein, partial [Candidatus Gracilibacteria bacterium]|nr:radical SAM protein [Candidatus Gracilibacteria bacterium]